jgi:WD40 repeat protein
VAARPWEHADQARAALQAIVADPGLGLTALSRESQMANALEDLLPDAPRERSILVMAAKAGLAQSLRDYVAQGIDASTAMNLTSATFEETSPLDPQACRWVVTELAVALGLTTLQPSAPATLIGRAQKADAADTALAAAPATQTAPRRLAEPPQPLSAPPPSPGPAQARPQADRRRGRRQRGAGVNGVEFSPDGQLLGTAGNDGIVRLWAVSTGTLLSWLRGHSAPIRSVTFSPDGSLAATASADDTARLWEVRSGSLRRAITSGPARDVAFSPDGRLLATAGGGSRSAPGVAAAAAIDDMAWLWDVAGGQLVTGIAGQGGHVHAVAFSPDGSLLATAGADDVVRLWDVRSRRPAASLPRRTGQADRIAFSPDGSVLATAGAGNVTRLWDVAAAQQIRSVTPGPASDVAFSPDGRLLATGGGGTMPAQGVTAAAARDTAVWLWDVATGSSAGRLTGHGDVVHAVAFSPAGGILATSSRDRTARLWNLATATSIQLEASGS